MHSLAGLESKEDRTNQALTGWTREQRRQDTPGTHPAGIESKDDRTNKALTGWTRE